MPDKRNPFEQPKVKPKERWHLGQDSHSKRKGAPVLYKATKPEISRVSGQNDPNLGFSAKTGSLHG